MTSVNGFSTTTKTTIDTTGSDIAQCIQKLNDENQRLRDALRTKERQTLTDDDVLRTFYDAFGPIGTTCDDRNGDDVFTEEEYDKWYDGVPFDVWKERKLGIGDEDGVGFSHDDITRGVHRLTRYLNAALTPEGDTDD